MFGQGLRWVVYFFFLGLISLGFQKNEGAVRFTQVPPPILYVPSGGTAKFVWSYHVDDRDSEFFTTSPEWYYIDSINKTVIAVEALTFVSGRMEWVWSESLSCPARLKHRLSKESVATLVISDMTTIDNGKYSCELVLNGGQNPIKSETQLIVTVRPTFLSRHPNNTYEIIEGDNLKINCTAIGPPTPNITWVNITNGRDKSHGSGSAVLQINDIKRYHAGVYECQAKNNPNKMASTKRTNVTVYYKPTILKEQSSSDITSWNGRQVTLKCTFSDGLPTPNITWYNPSGQKITTDVTAIGKGSHVEITTKYSADYGSYKCKATNVAGSVEHVINVTQLFLPGAPNVTILDQDIQASSVNVKWTKPGYDGGSPVIDYKVRINSTNPPQDQIASQTEYEFTSLTKNTRYEVRVFARNAVGQGNASIVSFTTKKRGPPPLPILRLGKSKTTITLSWTKPDENGGEIKNYSIYQKQSAGKPWTRKHVIHDLSNLTYVIHVRNLNAGQTWFIVTATNEFGESEIGDDKGKEAYILPSATTGTPTLTKKSGPNNDKRKGNDSGSPVVIAGAVGAVVFFLIAVVIIIIILRKKNLLGRGTTKSPRSDRASYHNDIDPDSVTQQGAAASLGGVDDGIPTYAAVDVSKKKKKKDAQNEIADYAVVDKSKKKRPGEIIYAELADFNSPGEAAEAPRPIIYTGTDYADITQFQKQDEPEPTYANFQPSKNFTNIQGM